LNGKRLKIIERFVGASSARPHFKEFAKFIFVYANMESKVERCKNRAAENEKSLSDKDYVKKIKQIDKSRAQNHSFISSTSWGNIHGYDLCINTSNLDIKSIIPQIAAFAEYWFSTHNEAEK